MNKLSPIKRRLDFIYLLWGLLFTKCFSLEYLVREYEVPINSLYYVWCLSITMATVATIVYGRLEHTSLRKMLSNRATQLLATASIIIVFTVAWTLVNKNADSGTALFVSALLMGIRQIFSPQDDTAKVNWQKAFAWILTALAIFFTTAPTAYLLFAFGLLLISVVPRATRLLRKA